MNQFGFVVKGRDHDATKYGRISVCEQHVNSGRLSPNLQFWHIWRGMNWLDF